MDDIQALREELADTKKKMQEYVNEVMRLNHELRTLKENVCKSCRKILAPLTLLEATIGSQSQKRAEIPGSATFLRRIIRKGKWRSPPAQDGLPHHLDDTAFNPNDFQKSSPAPTIQGTGWKPAISNTLSNSGMGVSPSKISGGRVQADETANGMLHVEFIHSFIYEGRIRAVRFSPSGKHLAVVLTSTTKQNVESIIIIDMGTLKEVCTLAEYPSRYSPRGRVNILCACFDPDGKFLAVGDTAGRITVWDIPRRRIRNIFRGHVLSVECLDYSPDGKLIVSVSLDKRLLIWNVRDGSVRIYSHNGQGLWSSRFSPNGRNVVAGNSAGFLMVWNVRTGQLLNKWSGHPKRVVSTVMFTPDSDGLMSGSGDGVVKYWHIGSLYHPQSGEPPEVREYKGHTKIIKGVAISPDGQWVASASYDKTAILWDVGSAVRQCLLVGHEDAIVSVEFSAVGTYLAAGSQDGHVSLWRYKLK